MAKVLSMAADRGVVLSRNVLDSANDPRGPISAGQPSTGGAERRQMLRALLHFEFSSRPFFQSKFFPSAANVYMYTPTVCS